MISCVYCIVTYVRDPDQIRGSHSTKLSQCARVIQRLYKLITNPSSSSRVTRSVRHSPGLKTARSGIACSLLYRLTYFSLTLTRTSRLRSCKTTLRWSTLPGPMPPLCLQPDTSGTSPVIGRASSLTSARPCLSRGNSCSTRSSHDRCNHFTISITLTERFSAALL